MVDKNQTGVMNVMATFNFVPCKPEVLKMSGVGELCYVIRVFDSAGNAKMIEIDQPSGGDE